MFSWRFWMFLYQSGVSRCWSEWFEVIWLPNSLDLISWRFWVVCTNSECRVLTWIWVYLEWMVWIYFMSNGLGLLPLTHAFEIRPLVCSQWLMWISIHESALLSWSSCCQNNSTTTWTKRTWKQIWMFRRPTRSLILRRKQRPTFRPHNRQILGRHQNFMLVRNLQPNHLLRSNISIQTILKGMV